MIACIVCIAFGFMDRRALKLLEEKKSNYFYTDWIVSLVLAVPFPLAYDIFFISYALSHRSPCAHIISIDFDRMMIEFYGKDYARFPTPCNQRCKKY